MKLTAHIEVVRLFDHYCSPSTFTKLSICFDQSNLPFALKLANITKSMKMQEFSFIANITGLIVIQLIDKVNKIRTGASVISERSTIRIQLNATLITFTGIIKLTELLNHEIYALHSLKRGQ